MIKKNTKRSLIEIFGYAPEDTTPIARKFWQLNACPFTGVSCSKYDHTHTICYGTCSVTNGGQNVIICPNRLYDNDYATIRRVSQDVFGDIPFMLFNAYVKEATKPGSALDCIVALGQNSGREVKLSKMSMDWVLAHIKDGELISYVGIEVQSVDITGNYRDAWYAARDQKNVIPSSEHGLNWANVHKRLMPQLIRKSLVYSKSKLAKQGLYFIVPEPVYQRFEEIIGNDIPLITENKKDTITIHTYELSEPAVPGQIRSLIKNRTLKFQTDTFAARFITGQNLPSGEILDKKIREILSCK